MRQEILSVQTRELSEVQRVYEEETKTFNEEWEARVEEFGKGVRTAQKEMKNAHMVRGMNRPMQPHGQTLLTQISPQLGF